MTSLSPGETRLGVGSLIHISNRGFGSHIPTSPRYLREPRLGICGRRPASWAGRALDKLPDLSRQRYVSPYYTVTVYAGIGKAQSALEWLERGYQERDGWIPNIQSQPEFDGLRSDPRFQALVGRMNFPRVSPVS